MNDRYLHRAKRLDNYEWMEGYVFCRTYEGTDIVFDAYIIQDAYEQYGIQNYGMHPVLISPVTVNECEEGCYRVDYYTICKYTEFSDKNRELIFENDIVKADDGAIGVVRYGTFNTYDVGFHIQWLNRTCYRQEIIYWAPKVEIIGNVIDNPDLFEVKE